MLTLRRGGPLAAAAMLALLLFAVDPAPAQARCAGARIRVTPRTVAAAGAATLCLLNAQRRRYHLAPLRGSAQLARAAYAHSVAMVHRHRFEHGAYIARIRRSGFLAGAHSWMAGENIAWGARGRSTPMAIVRSWMHSPPHRANILNGAFRWIGVGIAARTPYGGRGGTYTTDFGYKA